MEIECASLSASVTTRSLSPPYAPSCSIDQDAPDQVLAVEAARLVAADLLVTPAQLASIGSSSRAACARRPHRITLSSPSSCLPWPRVARAGHRDARLDHEIKLCSARFREDSLAAEVVEAADAAGEEVADGAQALGESVFGSGWCVMAGGGRGASTLVLSPWKRGSSESGEVVVETPHGSTIMIRPAGSMELCAKGSNYVRALALATSAPNMTLPCPSPRRSIPPKKDIQGCTATRRLT